MEVKIFFNWSIISFSFRLIMESFKSNVSFCHSLNQEILIVRFYNFIIHFSMFWNYRKVLYQSTELFLEFFLWYFSYLPF